MKLALYYLKKLLDKNKATILSLALCSYIFIFIYQYLKNIGVASFDLSSIGVVIDAFSEDIISEFISNKSISILFSSLGIAIFVKALNDSIFSIFANLSKHSINSLYFSHLKKIDNANFESIIASSKTGRSDFEYWEKRIISRYNISSIILVMLVLSTAGFIYGDISIYIVAILFTIYAYIFITIIIFSIRYYVFSLAVDTARNKHSHIASRKVRDIIS